MLYVNGDVVTARAQVERMLEGQPVAEEDLDDDAPIVLVAARLPARQRTADAVTMDGLAALGLPRTYPATRGGHPVGPTECRRVGQAVHDAGLRGVWCRSVAIADGTGRELAWFPARRTSRAMPIWPKALPYGMWRCAGSFEDIGLAPQRDPR